VKSNQAGGGWTTSTRSVRVLGIDPGTRIAGYAVLDFEGASARIVDAGIFRLSADAPLAVRLQQIFDDVAALLREHRPTHVALEAIFVHPEHARTAVQMAHGRGVVLLAAQQAGVPIAELPPAEIKKALTGNGRATKEQMQRAVMTQCGLTSMPEPPDVADAIAISLTGGRRLNHLPDGVLR
jgi:crossover junction endodeoxyribonuclease RuvC